MNALVPVSTAPPMTVSDLERIAAAFAQSRMFGVSDPAAALSLCLLAQAEGQHPAIAFRDYSIIQGKPAKKAEAMQRDFLQSGGKIEWLQLDDTCAKAKFSHPAGGSTVIDWTMDRAKAAGLGGKDMWKKYPRQMLRSRVISEGVRTVCPMATSGMYVPEEVADFEGGNGAAHASGTGEIIDGGTVEDTPERVKVPGIHKIKERLNKFMLAGNACSDLEEFRAMVKENKDDLKSIREGNHEYWTGDGEDSEGFAAWMERRYAELAPRTDSTEFQFLSSLIQEAPTRGDLGALLDEHSGVIERLDGEESRRFEEMFNARETALKAPTPLDVGAFGA